jgi:hypothetical protein
VKQPLGRTVTERRVCEFLSVSHLDEALKKRMNRAIWPSGETEWERLEQRYDVELAFSLDGIRSASPLVQLLGGKHYLDPVYNH